MKRFVFLSMFATFLIFMVVAISSCTKEGPAGPAGANGADGTNGEDGIDGKDGTATCIQCHDDSQIMFAKSLQWEASTHATGGNFERNSTDCAPCHTSQGFLERIASGEMETAEAINNPNPPNCYTCHDVHESYTPTDWTLTTSDPVELWISGAVTDQGTGNLCVNCHQPRIPDPLPVPGSREDITIGSPYWGPHHGPQGAMIAGSGGYEVGSGYGNSMHTTLVTNSCNTCHMSTAYGVQAGGHTMGMTYAYHGHDVVNKAGCTSCHQDPSSLDTKLEETRAAINEKLAELQVILMEQGVLDDSDHVVPGTMTMDQAGGVLNYLFVLEDRSGGTHNNAYATKLLENSIASLQTK